MSGKDSLSQSATKSPTSPTQEALKVERLWPGPREFLSPIDWAVKHLWQGFARLLLDTEENSWGFITSQTLLTRQNKDHSGTLLIAAENGAKAASGIRQMDRLLDRLGNRLPATTFVLFTGNDLCAPMQPLMTTPSAFEDNLKDLFSYTLRNAKPLGASSEVVLLSYLGVLQLITSPALLDKKITIPASANFPEETLTCKQFRDTNRKAAPKSTSSQETDLPPELYYLSHVLSFNPALYCPSLFIEPLQNEQAVTNVANRIRAFREAEANAVTYANELKKKSYPNLPFSFRHIRETANVTFEPDDIANDCFHLSRQGQQKIADAVLKQF